MFAQDVVDAEGSTTVSKKRRVANAPFPSVTVTVIVAVPVKEASGVRVTLRLVPEPPSTIPEAGTRVELEDEATTVKAAAGVSVSPTVNGIGPADDPLLTTRSEIALIVGARFPPVVSVKLQPPAMVPRSCDASSTTYSDQAPFGLVPMKSDAVSLYGPAGAGAGNGSPLSKLVGL